MKSYTYTKDSNHKKNELDSFAEQYYVYTQWLQKVSLNHKITLTQQNKIYTTKLHILVQYKQTDRNRYIKHVYKKMPIIKKKKMN